MLELTKESKKILNIILTLNRTTNTLILELSYRILQINRFSFQ